jgi:predicted HD superfamily hydrolase involved in NAD metabolism
VVDQVILDAITYHTTGRPNMTLMDKIIFVADYIEPNRKMLPEMEEIRKEAFTDLDAAVTKILEDTLEYLKSGDGEMDPMTEETYNYYKKNESIK